MQAEQSATLSQGSKITQLLLLCAPVAATTTTVTTTKTKTATPPPPFPPLCCCCCFYFFYRSKTTTSAALCCFCCDYYCDYCRCHCCCSKSKRFCSFHCCCCCWCSGCIVADTVTTCLQTCSFNITTVLIMQRNQGHVARPTGSAPTICCTCAHVLVSLAARLLLSYIRIIMHWCFSLRECGSCVCVHVPAFVVAVIHVRLYTCPSMLECCDCMCTLCTGVSHCEYAAAAFVHVYLCFLWVLYVMYTCICVPHCCNNYGCCM